MDYYPLLPDVSYVDTHNLFRKLNIHTMHKLPVSLSHPPTQLWSSYSISLKRLQTSRAPCSYDVSYKYMDTPTPTGGHWRSSKQVSKYTKGPQVGLTYIYTQHTSRLSSLLDPPPPPVLELRGVGKIMTKKHTVTTGHYHPNL